MNRAWIISKKDMREIFRSKSTYLYIFVMLLASSSYFFSYFSIANSLTRQNVDAATLRTVSAAFLNSIAFIIPVLYCFFACQISICIVVTEKTRGTLESLMATPLSIREIWLGKAVAVTIPSVVVGLAVSLFAYLVIALGEVAPKIHAYLAPSPLAIVSGLIVVPLLVFSGVRLVVFMQLVISNPRVSNMVFVAIFIVVLGVLLLAVYSLPGGGLNPKYYVPIFLVLAALMTALSNALSKTLTKERVVLSTRQ